MSRTKLRNKPIAEQIATYEYEIARIDDNIAKARAQQTVLRKLIRKLQRPDAEARYQKHMMQHERQVRINERKALSNEQKALRIAERHERMQREVEECLRMNGKIL